MPIATKRLFRRLYGILVMRGGGRCSSLAPGRTTSCQFCGIGSMRLVVLVSALSLVLHSSLFFLMVLAGSWMVLRQVLICLFFGPSLVVLFVGVDVPVSLLLRISRFNEFRNSKWRITSSNLPVIDNVSLMDIRHSSRSDGTRTLYGGFCLVFQDMFR